MALGKQIPVYWNCPKEATAFTNHSRKFLKEVV